MPCQSAAVLHQQHRCMYIFDRLIGHGKGRVGHSAAATKSASTQLGLLRHSQDPLQTSTGHKCDIVGDGM